MVQKSEQVETENSATEERALCSNCGQEVPEIYCTRCGQSIKTLRVSLRALMSDFLSNYFDYDSKFLRSTLVLLFRPGVLTSAFLDGKHVRYISPLRIYISASVIFFLTLNMVGRGGERNPPEKSGGVKSSIVSDKHNEGERPAATLQASKNRRDSNKTKTRFTDVRFGKETWLGRLINKRFDAQDRKMSEMGGDAFMQELLEQFLSTLPKALFLFMPFFALLLKLSYARAWALFVDHLVFAIHYHAFAYGFISLLLILGAQSDGLLAVSILLGLFACPAYLLVALKKVYAQNWLWTIGKFTVLSLGYATTLAAFVLFCFIFSALFLV